MQTEYNKSWEGIWDLFSISKGNEYFGENRDKSMIVVVLEGDIIFQIDNNKSQTAGSGEMILIPEGYPYQMKAIKQTAIISCYFDLDKIRKDLFPLDELLPYCNNYYSGFTVLKTSDLINKLLKNVIEYMAELVQGRELFFTVVQEFFYLLYKTTEQKELAAFISPMIIQIENNYPQNILM